MEWGDPYTLRLCGGSDDSDDEPGGEKTRRIAAAPLLPLYDVDHGNDARK